MNVRHIWKILMKNLIWENTKSQNDDKSWYQEEGSLSEGQRPVPQWGVRWWVHRPVNGRLQEACHLRAEVGGLYTVGSLTQFSSLICGRPNGGLCCRFAVLGTHMCTTAVALNILFFGKTKRTSVLKVLCLNFISIVFPIAWMGLPVHPLTSTAAHSPCHCCQSTETWGRRDMVDKGKNVGWRMPPLLHA